MSSIGKITEKDSWFHNDQEIHIIRNPNDLSYKVSRTYDFVSLSIQSYLDVNMADILQVFPDVPPAMADAVNRGGELLVNLTAGTPWEAVAKEVGNSLGVDSGIVRAQISKHVNMVVDVITSWMASNSGPKLLQP